MKKSILLLIVGFIFSITLQAQSNSQKTPRVNGDVKALVAYGDTIFVGGKFSKVFSSEGSSKNLALFDTTNSQHFEMKIDVSGYIKKIIRDETGTGFYIGGSFTSVGDSIRSGVAHLDSNGKVTNRLRTWKIENPKVNDIALKGDTLFAVGENLERIYSKPISHLKKVEISSLNINNSNLPEVNGIIRAMVTDSFGCRFICGDFTQVGNLKRNKLAKIDSNGNVLPWNPIIDFGDIYALQLNGSNIILAGYFKWINGVTRNSIAEVDTITGTTTTALNIRVLKNGLLSSVYSIDRWQNNLVLGGNFNSVGDSTRHGTAIVDLTTGSAISKIINSVNGIIYKVLVSGDNLYIGGTFNNVNSSSILKLAKVNLTTMVISAIVPNESFIYFGLIPRDLVLNGNTLYVGGANQSTFSSSVGLAIVNVSTNSVITTFDVLQSESITSLLAHNGMLYASGNFSELSGVKRSSLMALNMSNNTISTAFSSLPFLQDVRILGTSNGQLFTSGISKDEYVQFNNSQLGSGVLAFHTSSDSLFTISHQITGLVNALLISNDTLFIAGNFTLYGRNLGIDSIRTNFAALDLGNYDVLAPKMIGVTGQFNTMVKNGNFIIFGGDFQSHSSGIFSINLNTNNIQTYSRPHYNSKVSQMCLVNNQLYLAGSFTLPSTGNYTGLISTSALSGGINTNWTTDINTSNDIFFYQIYSYQGKLYTFGINNSIGEFRTYNLPVTNSSAPPVLISSRTKQVPFGIINSVTEVGNKIIVAGDFSFLGSQLNVNGLFGYLRSTGKIVAQNMSLNNLGTVNSLAIYQNTLYIGGTFDTINGVQRRKLASYNISTGTITSWNPSVLGSSSINKIFISDSNLFVGGDFNTIDGQQRRSLCAFNLSNLMLRNWNPLTLTPAGGTAIVNDICSNTKSVFFAGTFYTVNQKSFKNIFSVDRLTFIHDSLWNPSLQNANLGLTNVVYSVQVINDHAYILYANPENWANNKLLKVSTLSGQMTANWREIYTSTHSMILTSFKTGVIVGDVIADTVQGSTLKANSFKATTKAALFFGDTVLLGGMYSYLDFNQSLYEFSMASIKAIRVETSDQKICVGQTGITVRLIAANVIDDIGNYYIRLINSEFGPINLPNNPTAIVGLSTGNQSGRYLLEVISQSNESMAISIPVTIGFTPSKTILTSQSPVLCVGQNLSIYFADSANKSKYKYKWFRNDSLLVGEAQYILDTINKPGQYKAIVETDIGCADTTAIITVVNTGLCSPPSVPAQRLLFTNIRSNSVSVSWTNGNGTRRIVLAKLDTAVNAVPFYGQGYNSASVFGLGDSLGFRNYVVYNGSNNQCLVEGLIPGMTYHFAVVEYNETGTATSYQMGPYLIGAITIPALTFYNKPTADLSLLSSWGINLDGTGTAPTNFSIPAFYNIRNGITPTLNGNLLLDSNNSVLSIGSGALSTPPLQLVVPTGITISVGNINVAGNSILTVTGTLTTNYIRASDTSLVTYNGNGQILPTGIVGRCWLQGGVKVISGDFWVRDTLRLETDLVGGNTMNLDTFTLGTSSLPRGHLIRLNNSTIGVPFNRWIVNANFSGTSGLLPIGPTGSSIQLNVTSSAIFVSGNILIRSHYVPGTPGNAGLPLTESGITVNTAGNNGYWKVSHNQNLAGFTFNLVANANNFTGVTQPSQVRIVNRQVGGNWQVFGSFAPTFVGNATSFSITKGHVSVFGEFAIAGNIAVNPLPSELIYFDAYKDDNQSVKILWQTASETNSDYFEIQRSVDAKQFESIGVVNAAGNSSVVRNYEFIDTKLQQDYIYYYRLRMVDKNGSEAYSQVVSINLNEEKAIQVYPNPVKNILTIEGATEIISIYSSTGLQMIRPTNKNKIDVSELPQGVYIIKTGDSHIKFVKQ